MPATVAHAYFASDVYDTLPASIKNVLSVPRLRMFGQSTDSFFFLHLLSILPNQRMAYFQRVTHTTKTREFFVTLIEYIKENHLENDIDVCSFLCGFICHYALDTTVHPFVFYKTGKFNKKDSKTYKYNSLHTFMEVFLDNYLIQDREKKNPYAFPIHKYCFDLTPFSPSLQGTLRYVFDKVYSVTDMDKKYYQSLKDMKLYIRMFRQDKYGVKKSIYKFLDSFTSKKTIKLESISYHYTMSPKLDYLNFKHHIWRNPTTYSITSHDSFYDLYVKSLKLAKKMIEGTFSYLNGKNIDLNKVYQNLSYVTGLDCELKKELKYFEF